MTDETVVVQAEEAAPEVSSTEQESSAELKRKSKVAGKVTRTELYGAFVTLESGKEGIIHISKLGKKRANRVTDVLKVGDDFNGWVEKIDKSTGQMMLTLIEPIGVEWDELREGQTYAGKVVRLENFGAFVDIGAEKEGLVHVSEMSYEYIKHPSQAVTVGDVVDVKVLGASRKKKRINLSIKALLERPESERNEGTFDDLAFEEDEYTPTSMEIALKRARGESDSAIFSRGRKRNNKRQRRNSQRRREMQEDALSRTLRRDQA